MSTIDSTQRYKLKRFMRELKSVRGLHTELVTVYIPAGYELIKTIQTISVSALINSREEHAQFHCLAPRQKNEHNRFNPKIQA